MSNQSLNATQSTITISAEEKVLFSVTDTQSSLVIFGFILTMITTFCGNILVLIVIYRQRAIKNIRVTNSFLANLATVDLIMAVLVLPFTISINMERAWIFGNAFCDFNGMLTLFVGSASILTMAAISIDRHQAVAASGRNRLNLKQAWIMIAVIWFVSLVIPLMPVIGWNSYSWSLGASVCKFSFTEEKGFVMLLIFCNFLAPLATMIFCYMRVFILLRRHKKQLSKWKDEKMSSNKKAQAKNMQREGRATLIVFVVLTVFCLCWVPYVGITLTKLLKTTANIPSGAYLFSAWSTTAHAAANPIIYIILNKKFRVEVVKLLPFTRCLLSKIGPLSEDLTDRPVPRTVAVKEGQQAT